MHVWVRVWVFGFSPNEYSAAIAPGAILRVFFSITAIAYSCQIFLGLVDSGSSPKPKDPKLETLNPILPGA